MFFVGNVASEAPRTNEFAVFEQCTGIDDHVSNRAIFTTQLGLVALQCFSPRQSREDIRDNILICMKFRNVVSDILLVRIPEQA